MKRLRVPGGEMAWWEEGTGTPVVLVHGTPSSSQEWRAVARRLTPSHRVLAPEHLGFGQSDRPGDWRTYSLPWHVENLRSWFEQLQLGRFHLVVHDFGGPIALPLAIAAPEQVLSLTVIQSWFWDLKAPNIDNALMRWLYLSGNFSARMMVKLSWGRRVKLTRELHRSFLSQFPDRASRMGTWGFARSASHEGPWLDAQGQSLGRLADLPSLLVWGRADKLVKPEHLLRWKQELPRAKALEFDDVGHFPQLEAPEELGTALLEHLASAVSLGPPGKATAAESTLPR
ncbi:alpha/beta fold hydrolase [Corallococcus llansteffanensis]|uniref:Alpha/beta fold hydrolase n=1 Tax=Corallococcus llansteffanensis TaxID=2316731 RepID=A0A3A8PU02_9BACT|nr:alpha/beta fold hydrolase [Corallococcus llansteffanensis]RKH59947.1 alpha/beta fold hydrolase [Corallococcus llansteffanensis]